MVKKKPNQAVVPPLDGREDVDEEEFVGLSGVSPYTPDANAPFAPGEEGAEEDAAPAGDRKRTKLHLLINELWGVGQISEMMYDELVRYVDPDSAKKSRQRL